MLSTKKYWMNCAESKKLIPDVYESACCLKTNVYGVSEAGRRALTYGTTDSEVAFVSGFVK